jgi:hypothetical protein
MVHHTKDTRQRWPPQTPLIPSSGTNLEHIYTLIQLMIIKMIILLIRKREIQTEEKPKTDNCILP